MDSKFWGFEEGGYAFLSHSHKDIEKVRQIRNYMETEGFEPLCFYLKCLEKDDEIFELIKREIDAREYFIYLNSENARNAEWVQRELEHAKATKRHIFEIDLQDNLSVKDLTDQILKRMRVFVSYSHRDLGLAKSIVDFLVSKDLQVYYDNMILQPGCSWAESINQAVTHGCFIPIITKYSLESESFLWELEHACMTGRSIVPVMVGEGLFDCITRDLEFKFCTIHSICIDEINDDSLKRIYRAVLENLSNNAKYLNLLE